MRIALALCLLAPTALAAPHTVMTGGDGPASLAEAWALYTMDDERAVHAALHGAVAGAAEPAGATATDDVDDLLF